MRVRLPGYARVVAPTAVGIVLESCRTAIETILARETLYDFAARQPVARRFKGRATVFGIELSAECGNVVVRRSMRGGALAGLHTDLFLPPTRALRELATSLRLREAGIQTPEMIGFIVYRSTIFRRSDIVTREIPGGSDLLAALESSQNAERRREMLDSASELVAALSREGAHHSDLNLRNILVTSEAESPALKAYILDVDRIRFHFPGDPVVLSANIARLVRSMRKLRDRGELRIEDTEIDTLRERTTELARAG